MKLNSSKKWENLLQDPTFLSDFNASVRRRCGLAISEIEKNDISDLLNIGSGQGYLEEMFFSNKHQTINWTSLDITEYGLSRLKKYPVKTVVGFAHDLPFNTEAFDCCVCMEVLEHIPKVVVSKVYSEIRRVMKDDGTLLLSVPVYEPASLVDHPVGHVRKYTPKEVVSELVDNGFSIEYSKLIFSFNRNIFIKEMISNVFNLRKPSVIFLSCSKNKAI